MLRLKFFSVLSVIFLLLNSSFEEQINFLMEKPIVLCYEGGFRINARTYQTFNGVIYLKNKRFSKKCFQTYDKINNATNQPVFKISLQDIENCGLELTYNFEKDIYELFATIIISFDSKFVTKSDQFVNVHCIFNNKQFSNDQKSKYLSNFLTPVIKKSTTVPNVKFKIIKGQTPNQKFLSVNNALIGEPLIFMWYLSHESGVYGLLIENCIAKTKNNKKLTIIENGCSLDKTIVSDVKYDFDILHETNVKKTISKNYSKAFSNASAFNFPDEKEIVIICSIQLCLNMYTSFQITKNNPNFCYLKHQTCSARKKRNATDKYINAYNLNNLNYNNFLVKNKLILTDDYFGKNYTKTNDKLVNETMEKFLTVETIQSKAQFFDDLIAQKWCLTKSLIFFCLLLLAIVYILLLFGTLRLIKKLKKTTS